MARPHVSASLILIATGHFRFQKQKNSGRWDLGRYASTHQQHLGDIGLLRLALRRPLLLLWCTRC